MSALEYNQVKQYLELCHIDESLFSVIPHGVSYITFADSFLFG